MEIKINREIRNFTESVFWGLSVRQLLFSCLAVGVALLAYFCGKTYFGTETISWICVLTAFPFALMGFLTYHGLNAETFLKVWIRDQLLEPKQLFCKPKNIYKEWMC